MNLLPHEKMLVVDQLEEQERLWSSVTVFIRLPPRPFPRTILSVSGTIIQCVGGEIHLIVTIS
jgi:hypothetical protein